MPTLNLAGLASDNAEVGRLARPAAEKFAGAWLACLLVMARGNVFAAFSVEHIVLVTICGTVGAVVTIALLVQMDRASPGAGSVVSESPHEVTLTFTDTLEAGFSSVDVTDSSGVRVDEGKSQVIGNMIRIALKTLSPGSYRVHWRAVSVDTHRSEGSFTFSVSGQ